MNILGIDPGASGAIAWLNGREVRTINCDASYRDLCDFIVEAVMHANGGINIHAYIERVSASPGAGVSGMFRFGQSYGALQMLLTAYQIPFDLLNPLRWQQAMGCARPKGEPKESRTSHKNRTKARAQQLFPEVKITHANADAILLAECGRRLRSGELDNWIVKEYGRRLQTDEP